MLSAARWIALCSDPLHELLGVSLTPLQVVPLSLVCTLAFYAVTQSYYTARKSRAWLLTFQSSVIMSSSALLFVSQWVLQSTSGATAAETSAEALLLTQTPLSAQLCTYFAVYLAVDLAVGWVCYREHVHPLTGWVHHIGYSTSLCL